MPRSSAARRATASWITSLTIHGALGVAMFLVPAMANRAPRLPMIEVTDRELPEAELPKVEPPEPEPEPEPKKVVMVTRPTPLRRPARPDQPLPTEAPRDQPSEPQDTGPKTFGIKLSGTTTAAPGHGVQLPQGDSLAVSPRITKKGKEKPKPKRKGFKTEYAPGEEAPMAALTTRAKMKRKVVPEYPESIKDLGIEGRVNIQVTINALGKVVQVKLLRSLHPELDKVALTAAWKLEFAPATVNGKPVKTTITVPFTFVLD